MVWLFVLALVIGLFFLELFRGKEADKRDKAEVARLKSLPNYYRLCSVVDENGREYICRVREWNVRPEYALSELWAIGGPNPNGYTKSFFWANEDIEFLD